MSELSTYVAIFLDQNSKGLLNKLQTFIPNDWIWYGDHMTIKFLGAPAYPEDFPEPYNELATSHRNVSLVVTHIGISEDAIAVRVTGYPVENIAHITLAIPPNGAPLNSKDISKWKKIRSFTLHGKIMGNGDAGEIMRINEGIETPKPTVKRIKSFKTAEGRFSTYDVADDIRHRGDMFTVFEHPDGWIVRNAFVPEDMQQQNVATIFYQQMNQASKRATGNPLRSTQARTLSSGEVVHELSPLAIKLWDRLVRWGEARKLADKDYVFNEQDEPSETVIPMGARWNDQLDGGDYTSSVWAAPTTRVKYGGTMAEELITNLTKKVLTENTYKVYHGTNEKFSNFSFKNSTQGVIWFTDNIESIKNNEHGGQGNKYIMTRYITINKPAGWKEYEKYGLGELENMGYDGVILPDGDETVYFVFSPKSIRAAAPKDLKEYEATFPLGMSRTSSTGGVENTLDSWTDHAGDANLKEAEYTDIQGVPFVDAIEDAGGRVYQVGGAVRDTFLNRVSKDLDIMVQGMSAENLITILKKFGKLAQKTSDDETEANFVGGSFAVIKFVPFGAKEEIDIALARQDIQTGTRYKDIKPHADPSITLDQDLSRRDLTINAISKDKNGVIHDPYNGRQDIKDKIIRMVDPAAFTEDPVRMLRAVQFASRFDFTIEPETYKTIQQNANLIANEDGERLAIEFDKMVNKGNPAICAKLLVETGLYKHIFQTEFNGLFTDFADVKLNSEFFFLLTKDSMDKPNQYWAKRFKGSKPIQKEIAAFELTRGEFNTPAEQRALLSKIESMYRDDPPDRVQNVLTSSILTDKVGDASMHPAEKYPRMAHHLAVSSDEIKGMGIVNQFYGQLNKDLLSLIYNDQLDNDHDAIMSYIQQNIGKYKPDTTSVVQEMTKKILDEKELEELMAYRTGEKKKAPFYVTTDKDYAYDFADFMERAEPYQLDVEVGNVLDLSEKVYKNMSPKDVINLFTEHGIKFTDKELHEINTFGLNVLLRDTPLYSHINWVYTYGNAAMRMGYDSIKQLETVPSNGIWKPSYLILRYNTKPIYIDPEKHQKDEKVNETTNIVKTLTRNILKEGYQLQGAWFIPDDTPKGGRFLKTTNHKKEAAHFYQTHSEEDAFMQALEDGWVRIVYPVNDGNWSFECYNKDSLAKALRFLKPTIIRSRPNMIFVDYQDGEWEEYDGASPKFWNDFGMLHETTNIVKALTQKTLEEVRHQNPNWRSNPEDLEPLKDTDSLVVYHGFSNYSITDAILAVKNGISGQQLANRTYDYEAVNNPKGLFVSINFNKVKKEFAGSGIIIEFTAKVSDLEAPVWHGGGSYFVQGDKTSGFNKWNGFEAEREAQRLKNREKEASNDISAIAQSNRPELAQTLFQNLENQALFIGHLNADMIKTVWVHEGLFFNNTYRGEWVRMSRIDFIRKYADKARIDKNSTKYRDARYKIFRPNDDFNLDVLQAYLTKKNYQYDTFVKFYIQTWNEEALNRYFYPKQIKQIYKFYNIQEPLNETVDIIKGLTQQVLNESVRQKFSDSDAIKVERVLVQEFGETDPRNAAYLTPEGIFLNVRGNSGNDHRYVGGFIENLPIDWGIYNEPDWEHSHSKWLYILMDMGFIRLMPESGAIEMHRKPTHEQYVGLRKLINDRNGKIELDLGDNNYQRYDYDTPEDFIVESIKRYYNYGEHLKSYDSYDEEEDLYETNNHFLDNKDAFARIMSTYSYSNEYSYLYKNPKNLRNIKGKVRAIGTIDGDIYIADRDGDFTHTEIGHLINIDAQHVNGKHLNLIRWNGNTFCLSWAQPSNDEVLQSLRSKNPQFRYLPDNIETLERRHKMLREFSGDTSLIVKNLTKKALLESAETDIKANKEASRIYRKIVKNIQTIQFAPTDNETVHDSRGREYPLKGVKFSLRQLGEPYNVDVLLVNTLFRTPHHYDMDNKRLVFFIISQMEDKDDFEANSHMARIRFASWIEENVFIHEFIHCLDFMRTTDTYNSSNPEGMKQYFNSPEEYNAFTHEIIQRILQNKNRLKGLPFDRFLKRVLKYGEKEFAQSLDAENMKKIQKRLYKIYTEIQ